VQAHSPHPYSKQVDAYGTTPGVRLEGKGPGNEILPLPGQELVS
jgi:hypothetical protein